MTITADRLDVDIRASVMAAAAAEAIARAHRERIPRGEKADGSGSNRTPEGGRDGILGHETGRLAGSFRARTTGGKATARAEVGAQNLDSGRTRFLARNAERLLFAGEDGTPLSAEVDAELDRALEKMIR